MPEKETQVFYPESQVAWRKWLEENHKTEQAVWLVFYNKSSPRASISWSNAVDEALCFGWIDSKKIKIDPETSHQFFSKRKSKSTWSKINKDKVERLIEHGLMNEAGFLSIEIAKQNGAKAIQGAWRGCARWQSHPSLPPRQQSRRTQPRRTRLTRFSRR